MLKTLIHFYIHPVNLSSVHSSAKAMQFR